jgi:hypothetical protein
MPNPFFYGGKITQPENFVGRGAELRQIFASFENAEAQHTSIVGERRIGKSSLLYHVTQVYRQSVAHPERYRFIYVDLDDPHNRTLPGLLHSLLQALNLPHPPQPTLEKFQELLVANGQKSGLRPVICLDEFEHLTRRKAEFPDAVYEAWRSLGNNGHAAFITASQTPLAELARQGNLTSPFHNIFTTLNLGEFTPQEADSLLARNTERPFTPQERKRLLQLAGRKPGCLQFAARELYAAKAGGKVEWERIEDGFKGQFPAPVSQAPAKPGMARLRTDLEKVLRFVLFSPKYIGRALLDLFGRHQAADSSAWILGILIFIALIALLLGLFPANPGIELFQTIWRFFFPLSK